MLNGQIGNEKTKGKKRTCVRQRGHGLNNQLLHILVTSGLELNITQSLRKAEDFILGC